MRSNWQTTWLTVTAIALGAVCVPQAQAKNSRANVSVRDLEPGETDSAVNFTPRGGTFTGGCSGTVRETWSGITYYTPASCSGTYSAGQVGARSGFRFDNFFVLRSLLHQRQLSVVRSGGNCPSSNTTYNYLLMRGRSKEDFGGQDFSSNSTWVGGVFNFGPSGFSGVSRFSLNNLNPVTQSQDSFGYQPLNGNCSSGEWAGETTDFGDAPLGDYTSWLFGDSVALIMGDSGNPFVAVAVPQVATNPQTIAQTKASNVYTGLMTYFNGANAQLQKNAYFTADPTGLVFSISEASGSDQTSLDDTSQRASLGTLSCDNDNDPINGFCQGTLAFTATPSVTGKAACLFSFNNKGKDLVFCAAQRPDDNSRLITFMGGTSGISKLQVSAAPLHLSQNTSSGNALVTLTNLTSKPISTLNPDALASNAKLAAPFTALQNSQLSGNLGTTGFVTGSSCGTFLPAFSSCVVSVTYAPSSLRVDKQTLRMPYDNNGSGNLVNATTDILASRGLSSISVSAPAFTSGSSSQATVTATFANGTTQDVTSLVSIASSNSAVSLNSSGVLSSNNSASTTLTATFGNVVATTAVTAYDPPPAPSSLLASASSASQIDLSWSSGGGSTHQFQIAYQTGATAPATCSAGTVITAATQGSATGRAITGLTEGTQYSFRVCATNVPGTLSSGVTASATTPAAPAPDPNSFIASAASSSAIDLSWISGGGSTQSFTLVYQTGATAPASCSVGTQVTGIASSATSYTVSSLTGGTTYSFRLCGVTAGGSQSAGVTASATTPFALPPNPSNLVASAVSSTSLLVSWTSGGGSTTGFTLAYQTGATAPANCSSGTVVSSLASSASSYALTGLATGTQYSMRLCAFNAGAVSSSGVTATGTTIALPPNPTVFAATAASASQIDLSWTSGGGSTASFTVAYQTGATAPASCSAGTVVSSISSSPRSITGLAAATQYSFRLCALNSVADISSGVTGTATTNAAAAPDPTGFTATASGTSQINLGWTSGGGATASFTVAYQTGATAPANCSTGTLISNIASSASSQSVTGLASSTQYSFRLCALNSNSAASSGVTASATTGAAASVAVSINFGTNQTVITPSSGSASTTTAQTTMSALTALAAVGSNPISTLTLSGNGTFNLDSLPAGGITNLTINSGSTLTAPAFAFYKDNASASPNAGTTPTWDVFSLSPSPATPPHGNGRLILSLTGTLTVNSGGSINMDGKGYPGGGYGPGQLSAAWGYSAMSDGFSHRGYGAGGAGKYPAGGASYGTLGNGTSGSATYGANDFWTKLYLGSGGSGNSIYDERGGAGGGAISISAASVTNNGTITARGTKPYCSGGGGSGGTIELSASGQIGNAGTITVQGGTQSTCGSIGGNGRLYFESGSSQITAGTTVGELVQQNGNSPFIINHPASVSASAVGEASFSVDARSAASMTYQWQRSTNSGSSWNDISGATLQTLSLSGLTPSESGYQYRAVVSNSSGTVTSNPGTLTVSSPAVGSGGTIATANSIVTHTFTSSGTFTVTQPGVVDVLVVAGGGGGGGRQYGGGGGGGGVVYQTAVNVSANQTVTVGEGGLGRLFAQGLGQGTNGQNSSFGSISAIGGGGGGCAQNVGSCSAGLAGGSGGGAGRSWYLQTGGNPTSGQGNIGGNSHGWEGAGGGGAGGWGQLSCGGGVCSTGGNGVSYFGTFYGGGGGGGRGGSGSNSGGLGGGGAGGLSAANGTAGTPNTGGGGGGGGWDRDAGNGGSGTVIIRYRAQ